MMNRRRDGVAARGTDALVQDHRDAVVAGIGDDEIRFPVAIADFNGDVIRLVATSGVLDGRLEAGYAVFDGMILGERERAQRDADMAGAGVMGTGAGADGGADGQPGAGGDGGNGNGDSPTIIASNDSGSRGTGAGVFGTGAERQGEFDEENAVATYPVPEDIPSGDDDDVVARQLREAAMREPDPELREKLWDEYRKYTGLSN